MLGYNIISGIYRHAVRPVLFQINPETVHERATALGETVTKSRLVRSGIKKTFTYTNNSLKQSLLGIDFPNPVGLAAGFDYNGRLADTMPLFGFGFNTVGTVTFHPYSGNTSPQYVRLVKSDSLLINKGLKSDGAKAIFTRLGGKKIQNGTVGVSVGYSNRPDIINTTKAAIDDYLESFETLDKNDDIKYFELNISCPNLAIKNIFLDPNNFSILIEKIYELKIKKPIFIKMPCEIQWELANQLIDASLRRNIKGFIFSNLKKDRSTARLNPLDAEKIQGLLGNLSGRPVWEDSNRLLSQAYKKYGQEITLIGCGGIFSAADAYHKIRLGASLVQLITGMIFEGPQIASHINADLVHFLKRDGYDNISQAIGSLAS